MAIRGAHRAIESVGQAILDFVEGIGVVVTLLFQVLKWSFRKPFRLGNFFYQLDFVGVGSIGIVALTATFTGMVFAHQSWRAFELFNAQGLVGPTVALTVTRELSPVLSALMVTMRAGSAMCTELGTMRVTEQIDALEVVGVSPIQYLIVPRVLAGLFMVPMLVLVFDLMGISGGYIVAVLIRGLSAGTFISRTQQWLDAEDIAEGLLKGAVFGFYVMLISCTRGYNASGGAQGVGLSTTRAMVTSALGVFILDYFVGILLH